MKQPFRYFRGEFNGTYLYKLVTCPNYAVGDILDELVYQTLHQWKLEDEVAVGEMPIRDNDILSIAQIGGLCQLYAYGTSSYGSIYFTPSHVVSGQERSERGLFDMVTKQFCFVRTQYDNYPNDIINEASGVLRTSFVPEGKTPIGYLPFGSDLYTEEGEIILENLLPEPPDDGSPYTPFYGEEFLTSENFFHKRMFLTVEIFKLLFECLQRIRYGSPSVASFLEITRILCETYIYDIEIISSGAFSIVYYNTNDTLELNDKDMRVFAWYKICEQKFKLFTLSNRE